MWPFNKLTSKQLNSSATATITNKIYQAFYELGFKFTKYDDNNKTYVESGYNANSDVYAVVSQKATEVTRIPYYIKSVKDLQSKERYNQFRRTIKGILTPETSIKKTRLQTKAFEEQELSMPLDKPNNNQTWDEMWAMYETYMDLTGNVYFYLRSPEDGMNAGTPVEIYMLPSHLVQIVLKEDAKFLDNESPIDYYILTEGVQYIKFKENEVIHVKLPNPNFNFNGSHLYGQSPLRAALTNLQSSNSATTLNSKTLANGGSFGFISTKEPMTQQQAESLKDRLAVHTLKGRCYQIQKCRQW